MQHSGHILSQAVCMQIGVCAAVCMVQLGCSTACRGVRAHSASRSVQRLPHHDGVPARRRNGRPRGGGASRRTARVCDYGRPAGGVAVRLAVADLKLFKCAIYHVLLRMSRIERSVSDNDVCEPNAAARPRHQA